ncbi:hypothetical protein, partial [Sphingobacterium spiritivorum]
LYSIHKQVGRVVALVRNKHSVILGFPCKQHIKQVFRYSICEQQTQRQLASPPTASLIKIIRPAYENMQASLIYMEYTGLNEK